MWLPKKAAFLILLPLLGSSGVAGEPERVQWTMDESYDGPHKTAFNKLRYEVPILVRQTMIDLSVRCGLNFEEGWLCPLTVTFMDGSPMGAENVLAYVRMGMRTDGQLVQELGVNLASYSQESFNFNKVFAHELVHAMLNDSLQTGSAALPVWFHEGLAVYGANQGEQLLTATVERFPNADDSFLINGLEGPHGALDYVEDYLAFKYVHDRHGVNSLHNLIREVTRRKGDIPGAIEYTCFENWTEFQANARKFAEEETARVNRSLRGERFTTKPY